MKNRRGGRTLFLRRFRAAIRHAAAVCIRLSLFRVGTRAKCSETRMERLHSSERSCAVTVSLRLAGRVSRVQPFLYPSAAALRERRGWFVTVDLRTVSIYQTVADSAAQLPNSQSLQLEVLVVVCRNGCLHRH